MSTPGPTICSETVVASATLVFTPHCVHANYGIDPSFCFAQHCMSLRISINRHEHRGVSRLAPPLPQIFKAKNASKCQYFPFEFSVCLIGPPLSPVRTSQTNPNMSFPEASSATPLLSEKYSGIPERLLPKASRAKALIHETRTKQHTTRQRLPVIPQGVDRAKFFSALDELRRQLGAENVELNDKPLQDGW